MMASLPPSTKSLEGTAHDHRTRTLASLAVSTLDYEITGFILQRKDDPDVLLVHGGKCIFVKPDVLKEGE